MRNQFGHSFKLSTLHHTKEQKYLSFSGFALLEHFIQFINIPLSAGPYSIFNGLMYIVIIIAPNYKAFCIWYFTVIALVELVYVFQMWKVGYYLFDVFIVRWLLKREVVSAGSRLCRLLSCVFHWFSETDWQENFLFYFLHKKTNNFLLILLVFFKVINSAIKFYLFETFFF